MTDEAKKKILSANDIFDADDTVIEEVDVPEWGGVVRLRSLTAGEMAQFIDLTTGADKADAPIRVLMFSAIGEDGLSLFPVDNETETRKKISRLKNKNLRAFMRVQRAALRINGLTEDEKTVKND